MMSEGRLADGCKHKPAGGRKVGAKIGISGKTVVRARIAAALYPNFLLLQKLLKNGINGAKQVGLLRMSIACRLNVYKDFALCSTGCFAMRYPSYF